MLSHYSDLADKTFLVTGASSGIGQAVAIALGEQGAKVVITGRNTERLEALRQQIDKYATAHIADLTDETSRHALVDALPQLDGICHAAGIIDPFPIQYLDEARFDKLFDLNAKAAILLTARLLKAKKINSAASFVFISSISSQHALLGGSSYTISKSALEAFSRNLALEFSRHKIRSNCLRPAMVKTSVYEKAKKITASITGQDNRYKTYEERYPLGLGEASDIASATLFLLSDASKWISGTEIVMDGGLSNLI